MSAPREWRRACLTAPPLLPDTTGQHCAWLCCWTRPVAAIEGWPYCQRHLPWARAFAARLPGELPLWLGPAVIAPEDWEAADRATRAYATGEVLRVLARMLGHGLPAVCRQWDATVERRKLRRMLA